MENTHFPEKDLPYLSLEKDATAFQAPVLHCPGPAIAPVIDITPTTATQQSPFHSKENLLITSRPTSSHSDHVGESHDQDLMPDKVSFSLILCAGFLVNTNYFAIFPTVREYTEYTGADETFFGWVLSIQNLIQTVWIIPIDIWARGSFRNPLVFLSATGLLGNCIYALDMI